MKRFHCLAGANNLWCNRNSIGARTKTALRKCQIQFHLHISSKRALEHRVTSGVQLMCWGREVGVGMRPLQITTFSPRRPRTSRRNYATMALSRQGLKSSSMSLRISKISSTIPIPPPFAEHCPSRNPDALRQSYLTE